MRFDIDADAPPEEIEALVAQSQKRSAVFDIMTNPTQRRRRLSPDRSTTARHVMHTTTVVIGAGHAGLAMSHRLTERSIDHVVLERGEVANSWRTERWDSLRLLTPNWQTPAPRHGYDGDDPDGFMTMPEVVDFIADYAATIDAPVQTGTTVTRVALTDDGYAVATDRGMWRRRPWCSRAAPPTSPTSRARPASADRRSRWSRR